MIDVIYDRYNGSARETVCESVPSVRLGWMGRYIRRSDGHQFHAPIDFAGRATTTAGIRRIKNRVEHLTGYNAPCSPLIKRDGIWYTCDVMEFGEGHHFADRVK